MRWFFSAVILLTPDVLPAKVSVLIVLVVVVARVNACGSLSGRSAFIYTHIYALALLVDNNSYSHSFMIVLSDFLVIIDLIGAKFTCK